jgi:hypothetical protein
VDRSRLFRAKENKVGSVSRKSHGVGFFGMLFIDYFEKGKPINGEYYSKILTRLEEKFVRKGPVCKRKKYISLGQCTCLQTCFGNEKIKGSVL